jgi:hypothetical protein
MLHHRICPADLAGHKNLQVTLLLVVCWLTAGLAFGQSKTGAFSFEVLNSTCNEVSLIWDAFAGIGGNAVRVGNGVVSVPGQDSAVINVSFQYTGNWGGMAEAVGGALEISPNIWLVGPPCQDVVLTNTTATVYHIFEIYNAGCTDTNVAYEAFALVSGTNYPVGAGAVSVPANRDVPIVVQCSLEEFGWVELVGGAVEIAPDQWMVGTPCPSFFGTNVIWKTVYRPIFARVRQPGGGPETNALIRIYKKTIPTAP